MEKICHLCIYNSSRHQPFPKINLTDKNTCYISESAWSLRARRPSKEPGRTHTAKASSNTISFFVNLSLIICLLFFRDPANNLTAIVQVEMAVMRLNELCICHLPPSLLSLGFSGLLSFGFSLLHMKLSFIMLFFFFFSQTMPVLEVGTHITT